MNQEKNPLNNVGYKLHFDRLRDITSNASFIRTHKFKFAVVNEDAKKDLVAKFEQIGNVVDKSSKGSLLWFLVQLYGLGFLFVSKDGAKDKLLRRLYNQEIEGVVESSKYGDLIKNEEELLAFVTKTPRDILAKIKDGLLPNSMISTLGKIFGEKEISVKNFREFKIIKECHDELIVLIKDSGGLSQENLQEFFGINLEEKDSGGTTFVIQEIDFNELKKNAEKSLSGDGLNIYYVYFRYLSKAAQITQYDVNSLAGASDNQNALSNFFNSTLKNFQKSEDDCKVLLNYGNEKYFEKHPEILEFLAKVVHKLALKIKSADEVDFFKNNWGEYRALVGGRLAGWLSNFKNRIENFSEVLADDVENDVVDEKGKKKKSGPKKAQHAKVFNKIAENFDWENLFPADIKNDFEQLQNLRKNLFEALKSLKREENNFDNKRDFGSMLDEYNQYLQGFREFLMKWNNEGIPKKIMVEGEEKDVIVYSKKEWGRQKDYPKYSFNVDEIIEKSKKGAEIDGELNDKIHGGWALSAVPVELDRYPRFIGAAKKDPLEQIKNANQEIFSLGIAGLNFAREIRDLNRDNHVVEFNTKWFTVKKKDEEKHGLMRKNLESIRALAIRYGANNKNTISYKFLEEFITQAKEVDIFKDKFFLSGYERKKYKEIEIQEEIFDQYLKKFEDHFAINEIKNEGDLRKFLKLENGCASDESSERAEILKIYFGLSLRNLNAKIYLPKFRDGYEIFKTTSLPSLIFNEDEFKQELVDISAARRFLQSSIAAKIRADISLLSREDFIERNVIQTTNGSQSCLRYVARNWGFGDLDVKTRKKILKRNKRKNHETKEYFSQEELSVLAEFKIDVCNSSQEKKSNQEIAEEIFKIFSAQKLEDQKKLAKILGKIPHKFEVILKTKQEINGLQALENGLLIEKSEGLSIFQLSFYKKPKKDFLYSFPIETSVHQKQFLEKFLWQDKQNILSESLMGASVIVEKTQEIKWQNLEPKLEIKKIKEIQKIEFYLALPFNIENQNSEKPLNERRLSENFEITNSAGKSQKQYREEKNLLGIDLGEYGFGWAVFDIEREKFIAGGFEKVPLLKKMRVDAANWKDSQASGIFSRPKTHLAIIREQAAGRARNLIHRLALKYKAVPIYEREVDAFESGGQRISKLYKTLKVSDVISANSNDADKTMRKRFWGVDFAVIASEVDAAQTSQTCRNCGRSAAVDCSEEINNLKEEIKTANNEKKLKLEEELKLEKEKRDKIKKDQRCSHPTDSKERGSQSWFVCHYCENKNGYKGRDADKQAAQNIALKFYFKIADKFKDERENFKDKNGNFLTTKFFLHKSSTIIDK